MAETGDCGRVWLLVQVAWRATGGSGMHEVSQRWGAIDGVGGGSQRGGHHLVGLAVVVDRIADRNPAQLLEEAHVLELDVGEEAAATPADHRGLGKPAQTGADRRRMTPVGSQDSQAP